MFVSYDVQVYPFLRTSLRLVFECRVLYIDDPFQQVFIVPCHFICFSAQRYGLQGSKKNTATFAVFFGGGFAFSRLSSLLAELLPASSNQLLRGLARPCLGAIDSGEKRARPSRARSVGGIFVRQRVYLETITALRATHGKRRFFRATASDVPYRA